ncbi:MAG TPA: DUF2938 domain-containing protein [Steroidobacteraceae bacterium]|nr:DUF2938 domain-containing protein [Steroidobacteraceae bacterium]
MGLTDSVFLGVGATAIVDLWSIIRSHVVGVALPNYGLVGRWLAHLAHGHFRHSSIVASPTVRNERAIGWIAHYLIGTLFAALLLGLCGSEWMQRPTIGPALAVGFGTVLAPFLIMQPGMGAGIAASRTPRPAAARLHSFVTHGVFGIGLYITGLVVRSIEGLLSIV